MGTSNPSGTITVTPIYWAPGGNGSFDTFDSTYRTLVNRYITDIAAASGTRNTYTGYFPSITPPPPG